MRKQVQKERCTKIMLTKCKAVCHLYDKVQLAAAKMLDAEPAIFQFECKAHWIWSNSRLLFFAVFCFTIQNLYRQVLLALQP